MELDAPSRINFIPCVKWVRKGVAKAVPDKVQLNKEDLINIIKEVKGNLRASEQAAGAAQPVNAEDEFGFENYDNEAGTSREVLGIGDLAEVEGEAADQFSDSDESEREDDIIKPSDNLIIIGRVEEDASTLEVHIYNDEEHSFYAHHEMLLPAFPLCLEWIDHEVGHPPGNYCAVGSLNSIIDVWDLDIINCLEPAYRLGRKASRRKGLAQMGHTDAVLDLAWNNNYNHILASASVDTTILLWDLDQGEPSSTLTAFTDKVQCLAWHKLESHTLLAGGCDKNVKVFDCRTSASHQSWKVSGEAERIAWNLLDPFTFFVATSKGKVHCLDIRMGLLWAIKAHEKEVTGLSVSDNSAGLLLTASADGLVKIWDYAEQPEPVLIHEKNFDIGGVHCLELCPDLPFVVAGGGDNKDNNFLVYDLQNIEEFRSTFQSRPSVKLLIEPKHEE